MAHIPGTHDVIVLGGGCFWCTEAVFDQVRGVLDVESGYCNGWVKNPSYEDVCAGRTGHAEVVKLVFDPQQVQLDQLLQVFFVVHDPTTLHRQGNDVGTQYRSGIYYTSEAQLPVCRAFLDDAQSSGAFSAPVVTELLPLQNYSAAEAYHQDFFARNPYHGYCRAVAAPKVQKFYSTFSSLRKK
jgi:peptide-methionine (S)-S-oxide reductase